MDKVTRLFSRMMDYALEKPEYAPNSMLIISLSKGGIGKVFTHARIELLNVIRRKKPKTVGELVRALNRPKESVSRDLRILSNYGFISFKKEGKRKTPKIEKEIVAMPLIS